MIAERLQAIRAALPEQVTLVAVSKTKPVEMIMEAYAAGQRDFGENRPLELQAKAQELPKDIRWHMIGHLQTNKVKHIIEHVHLFHAVDSEKLLAEIDKRAAAIGREVDCLLQVHIAEEEHKFGFEKAALLDFFRAEKWTNYPQVRLRGLMGMATFTEDMEEVRGEFAGLKQVFDDLLDLKIYNEKVFSELSMGMSGDYSIAVEEGSTLVRIGSSIFGTR